MADLLIRIFIVISIILLIYSAITEGRRLVTKQALILEIDLIDAVVESMQRGVSTYPEINYSYLMHLSELLKKEASKVDDMIIKLYDAELEKIISDEEE